MGFREYLRWDGAIALAAGIALLSFGLAEGHQGAADAVLSGGVMLAGTGAFMRFRYKAAFRRPSGWFTAAPIACAGRDVAACRARPLVTRALAQMALASVVVVSLSFLTGFWLTYMDFAAWAMAIGVIKIGPAGAWIAHLERSTGTRYRVARRPLRGLVELSVADVPPPPAVGEGRRPHATTKEEQQKMSESHKIGGAAALTLAATFIVGFAMAATVLSDYATGDRNPSDSVAFLVEHQTALYAWYLIIFVLFGLALVPLVLALHERLRPHATALMQTATAFGLIWAGLVLASGMITIVGLGRIEDLYASDSAQAEAAWAAIDSVQIALGGGVEIVGALWVLMASAAMRHWDGRPAALRYIGLTAGAAGVITVVPALEAAGAVFGLGLIVWFAWLGATLVRSDARPAVTTNQAFQPAP